MGLDVETRPMDAPTYRLEPFAWWEIEPTVCNRCHRSFASRGSEKVAVLCHDDAAGDTKADVVWCLWCAQQAAPDSLRADKGNREEERPTWTLPGRS